MSRDLLARPTRLALSSLFLLLMFVAASRAEARSVYLNGVKIDGLVNQTFKRATVRIDSTGNVHITAKGYSVKSIGGSSAAPKSGPAVEDTYYLVATETNPGKAQWDIEVFINGRLVTKVAWDGGQVVKEISSYMVKGRNTVHFRARRNLSQPRRSYSPADKFQVIVGSGSKQGGNVVLSRSLATFEVSADKTDPVDKDVYIKAR